MRGNNLYFSASNGVKGRELWKYDGDSLILAGDINPGVLSSFPSIPVLLGSTLFFEADDGSTALPMLQNGDFDFLVTDWNMPGMEGIELHRRVRADESLKSLPVLLVTAEAKKEQIVEAAQAGVNGYIVKPFTAATLKEKIEKIFERIGG